jgi:hypothetical protein
MIIYGGYVDLAATGVNILFVLGLAVSLWLGASAVPRWRKADRSRRLVRALDRLDDYGRPVA